MHNPKGLVVTLPTINSQKHNALVVMFYGRSDWEDTQAALCMVMYVFQCNAQCMKK